MKEKEKRGLLCFLLHYRVEHREWSVLSVWSLCFVSVVAALRVQSGVKAHGERRSQVWVFYSLHLFSAYFSLSDLTPHGSVHPWSQRKISSQSYFQFPLPLLHLLSSSDLFTFSLDIKPFLFVLLLYTRLILEYRTMFTPWLWLTTPFVIMEGMAIINHFNDSNHTNNHDVITICAILRRATSVGNRYLHCCKHDGGRVSFLLITQ